MASYRRTWRDTLAVAVVCGSLMPALGEQSPASGPVEKWAELAQRPDFTTGVWSNDMTGAPPMGPQGDAPQLVDDAVSSDSHVEGCVPIGVPSVMHRPYPFEFVFEPGRILLLLEFDGMTRRIYTDGRNHPEDPDPTYGGYSIGHWESDTLVVDTIGFLPEVRVSFDVIANGPMRVVERMALTGPDTLEIETTVTAPNALQKPWTYTRAYQRRIGWVVNEYYCVQNPRAVLDVGHEPQPDLTPPE